MMGGGWARGVGGVNEGWRGRRVDGSSRRDETRRDGVAQQREASMTAP